MKGWQAARSVSNGGLLSAAHCQSCETWCGALVGAVGEEGEHHGEDRGEVLGSGVGQVKTRANGARRYPE